MLTVAPRLACNDVSRRWGGGPWDKRLLNSMSARGTKELSSSQWKVGRRARIKEIELWSLSRAKQPLFDSSPQWLFMKELD